MAGAALPCATGGRLVTTAMSLAPPSPQESTARMMADGLLHAWVALGTIRG